MPLVVLKSVALGLARSKLQPLTGASQRTRLVPFKPFPSGHRRLAPRRLAPANRVFCHPCEGSGQAQRLRDGLDLGVDRLAMSEFETCYLFPRNMLDDATGWIAHLGRRGIVDG